VTLFVAVACKFRFPKFNEEGETATVAITFSPTPARDTEATELIALD
jgi:hypothetical protein